ncbi:Protein of unknown function DUF361 [Methanocaldococcus sp. FS406-22]|uniref:hypothetical protein n=1 Tax=Methanocaldococcus sp. (strain FS406-22) TaxID=644281 RepID=UPI0001BF3E93|nr:hypothetical protein [Methanocaldococcus sp. FS406-22]ADC70370.1 Protein of unknown function DUF361 [Methanocaldococcus sp. FS406-22]
MKSIKKKTLSRKGQISMEIIILASSASLVAIIMAYFFVLSAKDLGHEMNKTGEKAREFINVTNNKSSQYIKLLNNSVKLVD